MNRKITSRMYDRANSQTSLYKLTMTDRQMDRQKKRLKVQELSLHPKSVHDCVGYTCSNV